MSVQSAILLSLCLRSGPSSAQPGEQLSSLISVAAISNIIDGSFFSLFLFFAKVS